MTREAATQDELDALEQLIDKWLEAQKQELPILREVVRDADIPRQHCVVHTWTTNVEI